MTDSTPVPPPPEGGKGYRSAGEQVADLANRRVSSVELVNQGQQNPGVAVALSVLSLLITWMLLFALTFVGGRSSRSRVARLV